MRNFVKVCLIMSMALVWSCTSDEMNDSVFAQTSGEQIFIDLDTEYQIIDGFGASDAWRCKNIGKNWPLQKREAIADLLFSQDVDGNGNPKGIGLSIWRFNIGAGSEEQGAASNLTNDWRRTECFLNADGSYDWTKQAGQQWFLNAAKERGVDKFLGFSIAPPVYFSKNGKAYSSGGNTMNIQSGYLDNYADFLVDVVDHFKSEGLAFDYLSPVNETQYAWDNSGQEGTPATNQEVAQLVKSLSQKLGDKSLSTEIVVAEAGSLKYLSGKEDKPESANQIDDFFASFSPNYIGDLNNVKNTISAHSYWTTVNVSELVSVRKALGAKLSTMADLGFWQSEFCMLENSSDIGGGWDRDLSINTALYVARVIYSDLTYANASSWQWWTALSQYDYKDGLIFIDNGNDGIRSSNDPDSENLKYDGYYRDSKTLWALGNYSRFIRPGAKRIKVGFSIPKGEEQTVQSLMFSAYKSEEDKRLILVFVNYLSKDKDIVLGSLGRNFDVKENTFESYTTSEGKSLEKSFVDADSFTIPARSIVTLVGEYR